MDAKKVAATSVAVGGAIIAGYLGIRSAATANVKRFDYACVGLQCILKIQPPAFGKAPFRFIWNWGDGRTETHTGLDVKNTWIKPGTYLVTLRMMDTNNDSSVSSQSIILPPAISNRIPCDTLTTVCIIKHDTIATLITMPQPLPSISQINVDSMQIGQPMRIFSFVLMGTATRNKNGTVTVYNPPPGWRITPQPGSGPGSQLGPAGTLQIGVGTIKGTYPTLTAGVKSLLP